MQIRGQGRWEGEKGEKEERREMEHDSICLSTWVQLQTSTHCVPRYEKHVIGEAAICML